VNQPYPSEDALTTLPTLLSYLDPAPPRPTGVTHIAITDGGTGLTLVPAVNFTPAGATATDTVVNGTVTGITIPPNGGGSYSVAPAITFTGGGGTTPAATAYLGPDFMLQGLITRVSNTLCQMIGRDNLIARDITETRDGGAYGIFLRHGPVNSITSVSVGGVLIPLSVAGSYGYVVNAGDGSIIIPGFGFSRGYQNVTVTYNAGYQPGGQEMQMLEQACLDTIALWWKRRGHIDQASFAAPMGAGTIAYVQLDFPQNVKTVIAQLKSTAVVF
jgi:hypothetical protein